MPEFPNRDAAPPVPQTPPPPKPRFWIEEPSFLSDVKRIVDNGILKNVPELRATNRSSGVQGEVHRQLADHELGIKLGFAVLEGAGNFVHEEFWKEDTDSTIGTPGTGESLIFVWGSGRTELNAAYNGRYGSMVVNGTLAVSDVAIVTKIVGTGLKFGFKGAVAASVKEGASAAPAQAMHPKIGLRALSREEVLAYDSQNITKLQLAADLQGTTRTSSEVAQAIRSGEIRTNLLGEEMFKKAYQHYNGSLVGLEDVRAFAIGKQIYLRKGSPALMADTVHEGKHALDFLRGFKGSDTLWEYRAWYAEREYLKRLGLPASESAATSMSDLMRLIHDLYSP